MFKKHKNDSEKIWKEVFGFDYYNIPDFKERFKTFLFKGIRAISKDYYKKHELEVNQDPFAINFFVEDPEKFSQAYKTSTNNPHEDVGGFSVKRDNLNINVVESENKEMALRGGIHEKEHSVHRLSNPFNSMIFDDYTLYSGSDFLGNIDYHLNKDTIWAYQERLKKAEDEIFAYFKNKENQNNVEFFLTNKSDNSPYDYADKLRNLNNKEINKNKLISEEEKEKLREGLNFLQSEYDRVLKNMIDVVYSQNESVEYLRNLPINEWYKASNGKYNRTDFTIKEFKF